jgi:hypothetical protein
MYKLVVILLIAVSIIEARRHRSRGKRTLQTAGAPEEPAFIITRRHIVADANCFYSFSPVQNGQQLCFTWSLAPVPSAYARSSLPNNVGCPAPSYCSFIQFDKAGNSLGQSSPSSSVAAGSQYCATQLESKKPWLKGNYVLRCNIADGVVTTPFVSKQTFSPGGV